MGNCGTTQPCCDDESKRKAEEHRAQIQQNGMTTQKLKEMVWRILQSFME